ncbi:MAG: LexA family protein [Bradyrhizobium sp.]
MALASPPSSVADFRRIFRRLTASPGKASNANARPIRVEGRWAISIPLMGSTAPCGFPSPADDYLDRPLDFNELLVENPAATFAVRVTGDSMVGAGIFPGDIAIVNRAGSAIDGSIVLALLEGEFTIKRYRRKGTRCWLQAENVSYRDIEIAEEMAFEVWGVINHCIRFL